MTSRFFINLVFWAALAVLAYSFLLLVIVFFQGIFARFYERKKALLTEKWRSKLARDMTVGTVGPFDLPAGDIIIFLTVWNNFHDFADERGWSLLGEAAERIGLEEKVLPFLRSPHRRKKLTGILTLGHLRSGRAWADLVKIASGDSPLVSLVAAQALMQIDSANATPLLAKFLVLRHDWPMDRVAMLLARSESRAVTQALIHAVAEARGVSLKRLLPLFVFAESAKTQSFLCRILEKEQDPEILSAALKGITGHFPEDRVLPLLGHALWFVRLQAVKALGRMEAIKNKQALFPLLADPEWWVRYRAAETLTMFPGASAASLEKTVSGLPGGDKEVVALVIRERNLP